MEPGASGERHTLGALCLLSRERRVAEAILASPKLEQVISFVVSAMDEHPAGACLLLKHLLLEQPLPGADPTLCARIRVRLRSFATTTEEIGPGLFWLCGGFEVKLTRQYITNPPCMIETPPPSQ